MKRRDIEDQVRQTAWPAPSPQLRDRVLSAAVVAEPSITWSDRIWFSRGWRLSAVAAALAIVVLDQVSGSPRSAGVASMPQALAEAQAIDEAGRQLGLPPGMAAVLARRELLTAGRSRDAVPSVEALLDEFMEEGGGE